MLIQGNLRIGDGIINVNDPFTVVPSQASYTTSGTYSWVAPANVFSVSVVCVGGGGSNGANGSNGYIIGGSYYGGDGGGFGGGGGAAAKNVSFARGGNGAGGAVRIIWPGMWRQFPSTRTADE